MVHVAYDVKELLKACPVKIESVAFWSSGLLVSCIDGSLRVYKSLGGDDRDQAENEEQDVSSYPLIHKADTFTLHKTLIGFSKKPITSMTIVQSMKLLITLSDAIVVYNLPALDAVSYLSASKGSTLYAWDEKSGFLCAAKQKRLMIFQHDGRRGFLEFKELPVQDIVISMAWCGDSLCLGFRREYVMINIHSGVTIDLFHCGPIAPPLVLALQSGELLLGKDNAGVFVGQNGKATLSGGISWSEVPSFVIANPPYALAWLSRSIEVRYLQAPFKLVQNIFLREMQLLPSGNHIISTGPQVIIASDYSVHALILVPLGAQIVQLTASKSFEEALALCKLLPPEDGLLKANKEDDIHKRYGRFLFEQKSYTESMQQFAASSVDLIAVLSLFPSIKLPKFCNEKNHMLLSVESDDSDPLDENLHLEAVNDETDGEFSSELSRERERITAMSALTGYLLRKRTVIVDKAEAEDTTATLAAIVNDDTSSGEIKFTKSRSKVNYSDWIENERSYSPKEHAIILDSALVQAQLFSRQSTAAIELLTGLNFCDVDACEEMMTQGSHFKELLQLYKYNELHHKVLALLNKLATDKEVMDDSVYQVGPEEIIEYMKTIGGHDPYLILESSIWLLKTCPKQAMYAYTSMNPPLPSDTVNMYLKEKFPELQVIYLEHLMENDKTKFTNVLQNELVGLYLQNVLEEQSKMLEDGSWEEHQHTETRKKLLFVLDNCTEYSSENLLKSLPTNGLHEERAILLGRLGQHQLALTLYAHKLHKPDLALKYCDKVFSEITASKTLSDKAAFGIYLTLLQVYLRPTSAVKEFDRSVASLDASKKVPSQRRTITRNKGHVALKIAQIEGWNDARQNVSSDGATESGKSDGEDNLQQTISTSSEASEKANQDNKIVMLDEALDLLSCRWDRIDVGQALSLLPSDTKLQRLYPFLQPLVRKSSETRRNLSVIKNLRQRENLMVKEELEQCRRNMVKITNENICSICNKKIGASVFVMYPSGILVHFVCHKNQKSSRTTAQTPMNIFQ